MTERQRDELWDVLEELFGPVRTRSARGRRNVAIGDLREAGVTPPEVRVAYSWCKEKFTTFTEMALCSHLDRALHEQAGNQNVRDIFDRMREAR